MIILLSAGIFFFSYGIYNTFCYILMLPTANTGRYLSRIGTGENMSFPSIASQSISRRIVKKWGLKWNYADAFEELLKVKRIYLEGTIYLISKFILFFSGVLCALPLFFVNKIIFWSMILLCILWGVSEALKLILWKSSSKKKYKRKLIDIVCKLLPGAFFIAQLMLFTWLFT